MKVISVYTYARERSFLKFLLLPNLYLSYRDVLVLKNEMKMNKLKFKEHHIAV